METAVEITHPCYNNITDTMVLAAEELPYKSACCVAEAYSTEIRKNEKHTKCTPIK